VTTSVTEENTTTGVAEVVPDQPTTPRWMRVLVATAGVLALLVLGASLGLLVQPHLPGSPTTPDAGSVDVGFAQDMSVHHQQAVLMAGLARDRSGNPAIRSLAFDIERTQLEQVGRMQGWLSLWNAAPLPTGRYMTWMPDGTATMPGMASPAELKRLQSASGRDFDVLFLQLMLRHHQGGAPMARYAAAHAETDQVRNLAEKILVSQTAEAQYLTQLLIQRGAQPLPSPN
jgi:uncharacterized protein (DUF305 family)